jgi:hypothetical protein
MFKFDLRENENLIAIVRQSEMVLAKHVLGITIALYFPITFLFKYELLFTYRYLVYFWILAITCYAVMKYTLWLLNVTLVTNERVLIFNYSGVFNKETLEAPLENISHISRKTKGILPSLFGYGDILIQMHGVQEPLTIKNIRHPQETAEIIWKNAKSNQKTIYNNQEEPVVESGDPLPDPITVKKRKIV